MATRVRDLSYYDTQYITVCYTDHVLAGSGENKYLRPVERTKEVEIRIHVNTSPVERSVEFCCDALEDNLKGAVETFRDEDIKAKRAATGMVVDAATNGFTTMIEKNVDVQSESLKAERDALSGELIEQRKVLEEKRNVMQNDYNRKKSRYVSLFDSLNKELYNRIYFLMKPCIDFVKETREQQGRRIDSDLLSTATVGVRETEAARIAIQASKIKDDAMRIIDAAKAHIASRIKMEQMVREVAIEGNVSETYYIPMMVMLRQDDNGSEMCVVANEKVGLNTKEVVGSGLADYKSEPLSKEDSMFVDTYYSQMLDTLNDGTPQARRLIETMRQLYANTEFVKYVNQ